MNLKYLLVCLLGSLLLIAHSFGQQKGSCILKGTIDVKNGGSMAYRLMLDISGNQVKGTSAITQDGRELRAKVMGMINREKQLLVIAETASLDKLPDSMEMCFFNSIMKWKEKKGKYIFSGAYAGKNKNKSICAQGKVRMETPVADIDIFSADTAKILPDTIATEPVGAGQKITEGSDKQIEWGKPTCTLEIWDGGVIDGDVITVLVNGKELLANLVLTNEKKIISIPLAPKVNTITIVAVDEGNNSPNTAEMVLTDGNVQHKVTAFNKKGKTANIVITRK